MADAALVTLARAGLALGGARWYPDAELAISRLASETGRTVPEVADLVALTSPRQPVSQNVRLARALLLGRAPPLLPSVAGALRYWRTTGGAIRGPKVAAFRRCLLGDESAIVVDRHMLDALGWTHTAVKRAGAYGRAVAVVRDVATELGETPRDTQAAIWVAQREARGFKPVFMSEFT